MIAEPKSQPISVYQHLYQIYPDIPQYSEEHKTIEKYETINKRFSSIYGKEPKYFVKCPGSLSLFGDPADYSELSCIECCTPNDVVIALAENGNKQIRVNHFEKSRYPQQRIPIEQAELKEGDEWRNQIVLGLRISQGLQIKTQTGIDALVYTDLLDRNDLGKTSSYLYSLALGMSAMSGHIDSITKQQILKELQRYQEKFEDLNIKQTPLYAQNNKLLDPSTKQVFNFLKDSTLVVAHSCTPFSSKSVQMREGKKLNLRRCEVQLGISLIKSGLGIEKDINNLKELRDNLGYSTEEMLECVEEYIPNKVMTGEEIEKETEKSLIQLLKQVSYSNNVIQHYKSFYPYRPITYLLKQQLLTNQIRLLLRSDSSESEKAEKISEIIKANRQLQVEYLESPSEEVSKLLEKAGQVDEGKCFKLIGDTARGNVVFLVPKHRAQFLIDHLSKEYYQSQEIMMMLADSADQYVYEVIPAMGAAILDPQYQIWL